MSLARYNGVVQDSNGNGVAGAHIEVRSEIPGQPLAALYSDRAGTIGLGNPFDADSLGRFGFYVVGGAYQVRAYTGASGAPTFEVILPHEPVGLNQESDTITQRSQRVVTASGVVTLDADDADIILIRKTSPAATRVVLPLSSARARQQHIADRKYDAASNNITIVPARPNIFTMTIASPSVFTKVAHELVVDQPISLETTGALPTNFAADTIYYVKTTPTADTFTLAATIGGSAINGTGSQSGVHTFGIDTIMGGASYVIDSNGGGALFTPLADALGWV